MKLTAAWQIDKKWQHAEPGQCRPVISAPIVEAMCGVALAWGWPRFTALLLIGFLCMLHPSEYLQLTRGDIIFPSDAMSDKDIAYVHVRNPKTARFARRQHCRLEDSTVLRVLEALFGALPFVALLYPGSKNTFRSQWNAILGRLGIPFRKDSDGVTPGVLRGSGATYLYLDTEDLSKVAWQVGSAEDCGILSSGSGGAGHSSTIAFCGLRQDRRSASARFQTDSVLLFCRAYARSTLGLDSGLEV